MSGRRPNAGAVTLTVMHAADAPLVAQLHATSWRRAYRGILGDDFLDGDLLADRTQVWQEKLASGNSERGREGDRAHDAACGWIARLGDVPVGFTYLVPHADAQWGSLVDNLHVLPEYQGYGIGRQLLHQVGAWCAQHAAAAGVFLWVFTGNRPARGFYQRVGGIEVEAVDQLASDGRVLPELRVAWASSQALLDATRAAPQL